MSETQTTIVSPKVNDDVIVRAKDFWTRFSKPIIIIGSAVILLGGGWLAYKKLVKEPKEVKASEAIFPAEHVFSKMAQTGFTKDSINLVLNGAPGITGVLKVASTYDGTAAGNLAHYLAGACYLQSKDFNNAIKHLKDFSTAATQVQTTAYSMLGDAYAELNNNDEAFSYYKKATTVNTKDEYKTTEALFKAARFAEVINKNPEAIEFYKKIKNDYPASQYANDVDKYLAKLGVVN